MNDGLEDQACKGISIKNYSTCPSAEIVQFTASTISTSFHDQLKIPSLWGKQVTRGNCVILLSPYGFQQWAGTLIPEPLSVGEFPKWKSKCQQEEEL